MVTTCMRPLDQRGVDPDLRHAMICGRFTETDRLCLIAFAVQHGRPGRAIIEDHRGGLQAMQGTQGDQIGRPDARQT